MRSMTGFGQGSAESEGVRVSVTLRGVNHRYLDLIFRLKDEYREKEPSLRELLSSHLERGRVEAVIDVESLRPPRVDIVVNEDLTQTLHELHQGLVRREVIEEGFRFSDLLRLPEVVKFQPRQATEWADADQEVLMRAASEALDQLVTARKTEGRNLHAALVPRLEGLGELVEQLRERRRAVASETAATLRRRIEEALEGQTANGLSDDRLAQEVAYLVDKSDVSEELDRLASHLEHFRAIMEGDGSLGKRLDFLTQEIFRELNTLGSKCRDSEMIRHVLDGKVLCEQMREQVQNIE